jgi:predicted nucleic acid-binding protein
MDNLSDDRRRIACRETPEGVELAIAFGREEARVWGSLPAKIGDAGSDNQIAATALVQVAVLATRNVRHFSSSGVSLVKPYDVNLG